MFFDLLNKRSWRTLPRFQPRKQIGYYSLVCNTKSALLMFISTRIDPKKLLECLTNVFFGRLCTRCGQKFKNWSRLQTKASVREALRAKNETRRHVARNLIVQVPKKTCRLVHHLVEDMKQKNKRAIFKMPGHKPFKTRLHNFNL
mmetsp:Transcript_11900/g.23891  ORF Transcript_11900/g.23891 Transcript_11900/m.23891 type:complete len:145 (-) Transcript_11900:225-659(-)